MNVGHVRVRQQNERYILVILVLGDVMWLVRDYSFVMLFDLLIRLDI